MRTMPKAAWMLVAATLAGPFAAAAETARATTPVALRDPMRAPPPPPAPAAPGLAADGRTAPDAGPPLPVVRQIVALGDQRYVVDEGRRRGVGDTLGGFRIESIDDGAVVIRRGKTQHRLPLHAGVVKQPVTDLARRAP